MSSRPMIAYFDDDAANLSLFKDLLSEEFEVHTFQNPMNFSKAMNSQYSAFLLDVLMPGMDGFSLCRHIKAHPEYNNCPVIFFSSDGTDQSRLEAYGIGAQDFIGRTVKKEELLLRLRSRISHFVDTRVIFNAGGLEMNLKTLRVSLHRKSVDVTLTEFKILKVLIQMKSEVMTREELSHQVWPGLFVQATTLNTHLSNLRSKLADWEFDILSIKSKGIQVIANS